MPKEDLTREEFLAIAVLTAENVSNKAPDAHFFEECDDLEEYENYTLTEYKGKYHILYCENDKFSSLPPILSGLHLHGECPMAKMDISKISTGWDYPQAKEKWDNFVAYMEDDNCGLSLTEWIAKNRA